MLDGRDSGCPCRPSRAAITAPTCCLPQSALSGSEGRGDYAVGMLDVTGHSFSAKVGFKNSPVGGPFTFMLPGHP